MKILLKLIFLSFMLFGCNRSDSSLTGKSLTPEKMNEHFFSLYESKSPKDALDFIFSTNPWIEETQAQVVANNLTGFTKLLGSYQDRDAITKNSIGQNYLLYTFLVKYDRQPMRFTFIYYKPKDKWQLQEFKYDDNFQSEIMEASSTYRLSENLP